MRIAVAFDHRGVKLRDGVIQEIVALSHEVVDLGTDDPTVRIDYPDKAQEVGSAVLSGAAGDS
jgi:ribose 5-phosphate isomerase B